MKKLLCITLSVLTLLTSACIFTGAANPGAAAASVGEKRYSTEIAIYDDTTSDEIAPRGGTIYQYITEQVPYARKEVTEYINPYKLPTYYASSLTNACAISAGGAAIGHYDRLYPDLIPNHSGFYLLGQYFYAAQGTAVNTMHQDLYTSMGTTAGGTSTNGYLSGFSSYVSSKGYTASLTSAYSNFTLNKTQIINALSSDKLFTIFMDGFSITDFGSFYNYSGYDQITYCILVGGHVMMCYGYYNVKYYNASNHMTREDFYLYVNTGYSGFGLGLLNLSKYITIDDGYVTEIY